MVTRPARAERRRARRAVAPALLLAFLALCPLLADASCLGMVLHAHRGSPTAPENSGRAILEALEGAWDGAETDIQQLRDGQWVLHHDDLLGRTTSLRGRRVAELDSQTWREIRLKDRAQHITTEKAPFLREVAMAAGARPDKVLNVEIKQGGGDCAPALQAVDTLHEALPSGQWFLTSIDRRQLQCARKGAPELYLGQILLDPAALAQQSAKRFVRSSAALLRSPVVDRAWLARLVEDVGAPVGLHIDIQTLAANPGLLGLARQMNIPLFTYSLGDDREHARLIDAARRREGLLPSGAIINGSAEAFCRLLPDAPQ